MYVKNTCMRQLFTKLVHVMMCKPNTVFSITLKFTTPSPWLFKSQMLKWIEFCSDLPIKLSYYYASIMTNFTKHRTKPLGLSYPPPKPKIYIILDTIQCRSYIMYSVLKPSLIKMLYSALHTLMKKKWKCVCKNYL